MARRRRVRSPGINRNSRGLWRAANRGEGSHSGGLTANYQAARRALPIEINARRRKSQVINHPTARDITLRNRLSDDPIMSCSFDRPTISTGNCSAKQAVFLVGLALRADVPQPILSAFLASAPRRKMLSHHILCRSSHFPILHYGARHRARAHTFKYSQVERVSRGPLSGADHRPQWARGAWPSAAGGSARASVRNLAFPPRQHKPRGQQNAPASGPAGRFRQSTQPPSRAAQRWEQSAAEEKLAHGAGRTPRPNQK
jgi:hypothetical protein